MGTVLGRREECSGSRGDRSDAPPSPMIGSVAHPPLPLGWCCPSAAVEHTSAPPALSSPRCFPLASTTLVWFNFFPHPLPLPSFGRFPSLPPARRAASAGAQRGAMPPGPPLLRALLLLLLLLLLHFLSAPARGAVYINHFLVELHGGGQAEAERVAAEHGFVGVRKVSPPRRIGALRCYSPWTRGLWCRAGDAEVAPARFCPLLTCGKGLR